MSENIKEIVGAGGGGKKSAGKSADNTLRSKATARIVEAISEGPIVGLVKGAQSIYFDETPIKNSDGSWNFDNVRVQQRLGLPDDEHLNGHSAAETVNSVETEVKTVTGPVTRTITDENADAVRLIIRINSLFKVDDKGQTKTNTLKYKIEVRPFGGVWKSAVTQTLQNEKCTSPVQIAHRVELSVGGHPWDIRVTKLTADSTDDKDQKSMTFESFVTLVEGRFTYPHTALVGLEVDAESIGQSVPERGYHVMGRIISVPSNYDSVARTYSGIWNGAFKEAWTNNPAWIFYDLLTNDRYGLGEHINEAEVANLKWQLYTIGQYCDEMIPSGFKDEASADIMEPRFTFNGVIRNRQEAYHALAAITTSFRGMGFWALGQVFATADMPADPVKLVTPANVIEGRFGYSSTALKARHSVAIVKWNDPNDFYRTATELVINNEALRKYGWREKRLDFLGCTSRGLAHRYGKWALDVENTETETVEYKASFDHMDIAPGDIVSIADPRKASVRMGGRVVQHIEHPTQSNRDYVDLDAEIAFDIGESYKIWLTKSDGSLVEINIYDFQNNGKRVLIDRQNFKVEPNSVFIITGTDVVPRQYRVISINEVEENIFQITGLLHDPQKYTRIEQNLSFDPLPYSREDRARPVQNLSVDEIAYIDEDGVARTKTRLTWEAPNGVVVREYVVQADTPTEIKKLITSTKNTSVDIEGLDRGDHTFYIITVDRMGRVAAPTPITHTVTGTDPIATGTVSNLILTDRNGSTEFLGRDVRIEWRNLFPSSTGGAATTENLALYDFNTVKVYDNATSTLLRTTQVRGNTFTYSFDHNQRDCAAAALSVNATRSLRFEVTVTSKRANTSPAAVLTVSNPVPLAIAPGVSKDGQTITVTMPVTADSDVRGMKVWIELNSGFDHNTTSPKFDGAGGFVTWQGLPDTTYYIRAGYYDHFDDTVSVSAPVAVMTDPIVIPQAPSVPTGLALSTELLANGMSRVTATWNANVETNFSHYDLLVSENGGNGVGFTTSTTTRFWDVLPGTGLTVSVRAISTESMMSAYSAQVSVTAAADAVPPAVPTGLVANGGFEGIWLEWAANTDADLKHYEVKRENTNTTPGYSVTPDWVTTATTIYDGSLNGEVTRYYWVRAVDTSGNKSAWSAVATTTTTVISQTSFASGLTVIEILNALPSAGNFEGRSVLLTTDGKYYRYHSGAWTAAVQATDVNGQLTATQIASVNAAAIAGQLTNAQLASIDAAKLTGVINEARIVSVAASKVTGQLSDTQIAEVSTAKLAGEIAAEQLSDDAALKGSAVFTMDEGMPYSFEPGTNSVLASSTEKFSGDHSVSVTWLGASDPVSSQTTEGARIVIPDYIALRLAGKRIRVSGYAKKTASNASSEFAVAYSTNDNGNSGWYSFAPSDSWTRFEFFYDMPLPVIGGSDYLGFWADTSNTGKSVLLDQWNIEIVEDLANVPGQVSETQISDSAISTPKLQANAVTAQTIAANAVVSDKIAAGSILADKIATGAVTASKVAANAITAASIVSGAVSTAKLAVGAVTADKIAANAVTAASIAAGAITAAKIAVGAVQASSIAAEAITGDKIAANSIAATHIVAGSITATEIAANTITAAQITANTITAAQIAANTITAAEIAANAITASKIASDSVQTIHLVTDAVTTAKIAAGAVTASEIAAGAITASHIQSNQVITNTANILDGIITNAKIANATIQAAKIANATITSAQISSIDASKITVSGTTTLADWRYGSDVTRINGGSIAANTILANSVTIGVRGITVNGIQFSISGNVLSWTAGSIRYIGNNGSAVTVNISAGSATWTTGVLMIYWVQNATVLSSTIVQATAMGSNNVVLAQYKGGTDLVTEYGRTIIEGSWIKTGTIQAQHIAANTITAAQIASGTITGTQIAAETISATQISSGAITTSKLASDSVQAQNIAASAITSDKIEAGAVTASKLSVGSNINLISNSDFSQGLTGWTTFGSGVIGNYRSHVIRTQGMPWAGAGVSVMEFKISTGVSNDGWAHLRFVPRGVDGEWLIGISIGGGGYYEISANVSRHRCKIRLVVEWRDENGAWISKSTVVDDTSQVTGTNTDPDGWDRIGGIALAPSNARYARPCFEIYEVTDNPDAYLFVYKPLFGPTKQNAELMEYQPGGVTIIDGGSIITESVTSTKIAAGAITADKISVTSLDAISANLGSIQVGTANIGNLSVAGEKIQNGAVSSTAITAGGYTASTGSWVTIATMYLTSVGNARVIAWGIGIPVAGSSGSEGTEGRGNVRILINGNVVDEQLAFERVPLLGFGVSAVGSTQISIQVMKTGGDGTFGAGGRVAAVELRK